jgi:hypothetical protein
VERAVQIIYLHRPVLAQFQFIAVLLYFFAICFIRLSITAFLYRLVGVASPTKRLLLHLTVALLLMELIVQVCAYAFSCQPISAVWDMDVRLASFTAINVPLEKFILGVIYFVTDVWLLLLPIQTIWALQMPLRARIGATCIFIFGAVACTGAIVKTTYVYPVFNSYDPTCKSALAHRPCCSNAWNGQYDAPNR